PGPRGRGRRTRPRPRDPGRTRSVSLSRDLRVPCEHERPADVVIGTAGEPFLAELLPAAVYEGDESAVTVRREGDLDLGRLRVVRSARMPREADPRRDFEVEHLAPERFLAALRA